MTTDHWLTGWQTAGLAVAAPGLAIGLATISMGQAVTAVVIGIVSAIAVACWRAGNRPNGAVGNLLLPAAIGGTAPLAAHGTRLLFGGAWTALAILVLGGSGGLVWWLRCRPAAAGGRAGGPSAAVIRVRLELPALSAEELSYLWRTFVEAQTTAQTTAQRHELALARDLLLGEFGRRAPHTFEELSSFLLADPAADPLPFLLPSPGRG